MVSKIMILGTLLAVFLMLMLPNSTAYEFTILKKETPKYKSDLDVQETKDKVIENIEQLKEQQKEKIKN